MPTNIGQKFDVCSSSFAPLQHCIKQMQINKGQWLAAALFPPHSSLLCSEKFQPHISAMEGLSRSQLQNGSSKNI